MRTLMKKSPRLSDLLPENVLPNPLNRRIEP
jgi:hypothetical protein